MKLLIIGLILLISLTLFGDVSKNNDFFDDSKTVTLKGPDIIIAGEVSKPGKVDLSQLPMRSVIVRETVLKANKKTFVGAYRYDGYSLYDILKDRLLKKKNLKEFKPPTDMMIMIENSEGKKVVISWGEVYYSSIPHQIIVATKVMRIVPFKTNNQWPLPKTTKVICAQDLITERNLGKPAKITVFSTPLKLKVDLYVRPYANKISIYKKKILLADIAELNPKLQTLTYPCVYYGRGKGFHGFKNYKGCMLKSVLKEYLVTNQQNLRTGYIVLSSVDGYRVSLSFSEIFNRNDQSEFLLVDQGKNIDKGHFRLYPAADFLSDRGIFSINGIYLLNI